MDKKDILDTLFIRAYKMIKDEIIPVKKDCPDEELFWRYIKRELGKEEKGQIEGHLLACNECMETLRTIGMIIKAEAFHGKLPEGFHKRAEIILENELRKNILRAEKEGVARKITLLWDKLQNRIIPVNKVSEEMMIHDGLEFNVVREPLDSEGHPAVFIFKTDIGSGRGTALFKIERSGSERDLILKIYFPPDHREGFSNVRANLYKSGRIHSSLFFNKRGEALFHRINEGDYLLEFLEGEKILTIIKLSILIHKDER